MASEYLDQLDAGINSINIKYTVFAQKFKSEAVWNEAQGDQISRLAQMIVELLNAVIAIRNHIRAE